MSDRQFFELPEKSVEELLETLRPRLTLTVPNRLAGEDTQLRVNLEFKAFRDFGPDGLTMQVAELRAHLAERATLATLLSKRLRNDDALARAEHILPANGVIPVANDADIPPAMEGLEDLIVAIKPPLLNSFDDSATRQELLSHCARRFADMIQAARRLSVNFGTLASARIIELDTLLSAQVNAILHAKEFQCLEATWRGLAYLASQCQLGALLKIKVLDVSRKELAVDRDRNLRLSTLFRRVYVEGFDTFGGEPFGVLLGDYDFTQQALDVKLLRRFAEVAAASHAPFVGAVGAGMFGLPSFDDLHRPSRLADHFTTNSEWSKFRRSEDSRYVGLALPRILSRRPYGPGSCASFDFEEDVDGHDASNYLWGNPAYVVGVRLADAFAKHRWCATMRGVGGPGGVERLLNPALLPIQKRAPTHSGTYPDPVERVVGKSATEVTIASDREKELAALGFVPLVPCRGTDFVAFYSAQSCHDVAGQDEVNQRIASQLPHIFVASRVAHYLKAQLQEEMGSSTERETIERNLTTWINNYCSPNAKSSNDKPLREATVSLVPVEDDPGRYTVELLLKPHFQLEDLPVELTLHVRSSSSDAR
jgi:type VI secretion system protein ImpC